MHCVSWIPYLFRFSVAILACLGLLFMSGCEGRKDIVHGLSEREANEILVYLENRGVPAEKQKEEAAKGAGGAAETWLISVSNSRSNEAMALLNQAGLPRRVGQDLLGIFKEPGLVPSELTERIRYTAGLGEQLASIIRKFDGVLDAYVQISFPEEDPLNPTAPKGKATASVYVKHQGVLDDPNSHLATKIRRLVASSINGLNFDDVTVVGERARYSDTSAPNIFNVEEEAHPLVTVWSLIVARESLTRFRVIFFSFFISILILMILVIWMLWKIWPAMQKAGGLSALASFKPLIPPEKPAPAAKAEGEEKKGEKGKGKETKKKVEAAKKEEEVAEEEEEAEAEEAEEEEET